MGGTEVTSNLTVDEVPCGSPLRVGDVGTIVSTLGRGSYGRALVCLIGGRRVVAKCANSAGQRQMTRAEYDVLESLGGADGHAPAALGFGAISAGTERSDALIEELCEGLSLREIVEHRLRGRESDVSAASVAAMGVSIATAVQAIGGRGIRHGDLSCTNVLLRQAGPDLWHCTVVDFGQATESARAEQTDNRPGTVAFSAPEMFRGAKFARFKNRTSADLYSVGALLFYMRTWGHFEDREPGSYFEQFSDPGGGPGEGDGREGQPLDLVRALKGLGVDAARDDRELATLITELTELDPRLRPQADECLARLSRIAGLSPASIAFHRRLAIACRFTRRLLARPSRILRTVARVTRNVLVAWWIIAAVFTGAYYFMMSRVEVDEDSALWRMIDENYHEDDRDTYDPHVPGLREHSPSLWLGQIDLARYGAMTAHYTSDKYILSDGCEFRTGKMAYTDTHEVLVVPFKDSWDEMRGPIRWGDNLLQMTVAARGGWEDLSYRYITPRPDRDMGTLQQYLESNSRYVVETGETSRGGIDFTYTVSSHARDDSEGQGGYMAVTCYSQRSDSCILEAQAFFYTDGDGPIQVTKEELLEDLLGSIQVRSTNLDDITAASPYSDATIVSEDGRWQALIKEDANQKPYMRTGREWYYHRLSACTAMQYSESFEYDFAPESGSTSWLLQEDFGEIASVVDSGMIPAADGITVRWSLADIGRTNRQMRLRAYLEIEDSALTIQGYVGDSAERTEIINDLLLNTIEISMNRTSAVGIENELT